MQFLRAVSASRYNRAVLDDDSHRRLAPGVYEVLAAIGAGGMGEVFRARDTRLQRDVALKVLPAAFASDPDRVARLAREAQVLASLNHQHIAQIYGLEESGERRALVMELVEGETLADVLARGRSTSMSRSRLRGKSRRRWRLRMMPASCTAI